MKLPTLFDRLTPRLLSARNVNGNGTKALRAMRHALSPQWQFWPLSDVTPGSSFNYAAAVGDTLDSSVVSAALSFIMRTFPEAPAVVQELEEDQWRTIRRGHGNARTTSLARRLRNPNPFYGPRVLWMATCIDFAFGEAFWIKIRNAIGEVIQYWWVPRALMVPRWPADGSTFISHYDYYTGGEPVPLETRDVVHFRFGMDPRNPRRGFSQLAAVVREIYTDEQAAAFTAAILRNLGVIGVIISPKAPSGTAKEAAASEQDVKEVRDYIDANFRDEQRGKTLALGSPTEAQLLQYNLQGFDMGPIRDIAEERVSAALGLPAAVLGFGTGLQQTKVGATMRELIQLAWKACLIPMQKIIAEELGRSSFADFGIDEETYRVAFDTSDVMALWEDAKERGARVSQLFTSGVIKRGEARRELSLQTEEQDDIYVLPTTVTPEGQDQTPPPPPTGQPGDLNQGEDQNAAA